MLRALLSALLAPKRPAPAEPLLDPDDLEPSRSPAATLLATAVRAANAGDARGAADALDRATGAEPSSPWPWILRHRIQSLAGDAAAAAQSLARAAELDVAGNPAHAAAQRLYTRGRVHLRDGRVAASRRCLGLAHGLYPQASEPLGMLGFAGYFDGDVEAGRRDYDRALAVAAPHERGPLRINRMIDTLPQVFDSPAHVDASRRVFEADLAALAAEPPAIADPLGDIHRTVFYLCYQGGNDRALNERLARLFLRATPSLGHVAAHVRDRTRARAGAKPRVGIVSMFLTGHSVGAWYRELVRQVVESGRHDCVLFTYDGAVDEGLRLSAERHGRHVYLGSTIEEARRQIEACELDLLAYTDVGMHPFPYFLAFSRLAPVQALLVGHPCTSGIPTLDYFVSNVHQDLADAQSHYSERLVRLPVIPVRVPATPRPARLLSRAECGFGDGMRTYLCPMMLQKMHPAFDAAIAGILRRDPAAELVLFRDRARPSWERRLVQRFEREMPDVADRIAFRPFAAADEFASLLLQADCVLDPFLFSGGVTTYVALSLGVPVVTMPGPLFRSRMTAGIYAQAGVLDCVARSPGEYVELALALANDPARRQAIGAKLLDASAKIFDTAEGGEAFMDWIDTVAGGGR